MDERRMIALVLAIGIVLGVLTRIADNQENALSWLGSLTAPWILSAFVAGALSRSPARGAATGALSLTLAVSVYYAWMRIFEGGVNFDYFLSITTFWLLLAPPAGAVFGLAGAVWQASSHRTVPALAVGIPAGLIAGESAFMAVTTRTPALDDLAVLGGFVLMGLSLPGVLLDGTRSRVSAYVVAGCMLAAGLATVPVIRMLIAQLQ